MAFDPHRAWGRLSGRAITRWFVSEQTDGEQSIENAPTRRLLSLCPDDRRSCRNDDSHPYQTVLEATPRDQESGAEVARSVE